MFQIVLFAPLACHVTGYTNTYIYPYKYSWSSKIPNGVHSTHMTLHIGKEAVQFLEDNHDGMKWHPWIQSCKGTRWITFPHLIPSGLPYGKHGLMQHWQAQQWPCIWVLSQLLIEHGCKDVEPLGLKLWWWAAAPYTSSSPPVPMPMLWFPLGYIWSVLNIHCKLPEQFILYVAVKKKTELTCLSHQWQQLIIHVLWFQFIHACMYCWLSIHKCMHFQVD